MIIKSFYNGIKSLLILVNLYFLYLAEQTKNYIAFTFLVYLLILLIFPYLYRLYRWYSKERNITFFKIILVYISFISISTLLFIVIQWYVIDSIGLRDLYRTIQDNFTQAYQTTR